MHKLKPIQLFCGPKVRTRNSMSSKEWVIYDDLDSNDLVQINWRKFTNSMAMEIFCKEMVIEYCGGYKNNNRLVKRRTTIRLFVESLKKIVDYIEKYTNYSKVSQLEKRDLNDLVMKLLTKEIRLSVSHYVDDSTSKIRKFCSFEQIVRVILTLNNSHRLNQIAKTSDGLSFLIEDCRKFVSSIIRPYIRSLGLEKEYFKNKHWNGVPLEITSALLSKAIDNIRDVKTQALLKYFELQNGPHKILPTTLFIKHDNAFNKFCKSGFSQRPQNRSNEKKYKIFKDELEKILKQRITRFPWTQGEIKKACDKLFDNCIIIFLTLTGVRASELVKISSNSYEIKDDAAMFKTEITKTNYSCPELMVLTGLTLEAFHIMRKLSYVHKSNLDLPLIGRYYYLTDLTSNTLRDTKFRTQTTKSISYRLKNHYKKLAKEIDSDFLEICPKISPHRFRHSFAEYSMRRFDGDVLEAVRIHFRHRAFSRFTRDYVENKLNAPQQRALEKDFYQELYNRIGYLESSEWFGSAAIQIQKIADRIDFVSLNELDSPQPRIKIDSNSEIGIHPYGYCLISSSNQMLSNCFDKKTSIPYVKSSCFATCANCPNLCHHKKSNLQELRRIVISHTDFLEKFPFAIAERLVKESERCIAYASKIIQKMEYSHAKF